jgi:hypothetical protein
MKHIRKQIELAVVESPEQSQRGGLVRFEVRHVSGSARCKAGHASAPGSGFPDSASPRLPADAQNPVDSRYLHHPQHRGRADDYAKLTAQGLSRFAGYQ